MKQPQRIPTALVHDAATTVNYSNMCAGNVDVARLCIYKYLKE